MFRHNVVQWKKKFPTFSHFKSIFMKIIKFYSFITRRKENVRDLNLCRPPKNSSCSYAMEKKVHRKEKRKKIRGCNLFSLLLFRVPSRLELNFGHSKIEDWPKINLSSYLCSYLLPVLLSKRTPKMLLKSIFVYQY